MRISKKAVDSLVTTAKDTFHWDDDLAGFGVKVTPKGRKIFVLQTRLHGNTRRFTIGTYGQPWAPDAARDEAKRLLGQVTSGVDPRAVKNSHRDDMTVSQLAEIYWKEATGHKKQRTMDNERGLNERHIRPLLGREKLKALKKQDIQKFVNDVAAGKTAVDMRTKARGRVRVTGGKGAANRTFGLLSSMLTFAVDRQLISENPASGVRQFKLKQHDRFLSSQETERLGMALSFAELSGESLFAIAAIRFLSLSGCRKNEALTLQWGWIDFENNLAKLPDSKTGQKILFLGRSAMDLIRALPKIDGTPLVFPSAAGGLTPISLQKVWRKVRTVAELGDVRVHDLRHNFASSAVASGQSLYIVGKLLGHKQTSTTQRYAHLGPDPIRGAADATSQNLGKLLVQTTKGQSVQ